MGGDDDDQSSKDSEDETKGNTKFSNTQTMGDKPENKQGLICKRPIIFICDDAYSKGLRPLKRYCHNFKLEKNEEALVDRLKHINKEEVEFDNKNLGLDNDTVVAIAKGYNNDVAGCLGFMELISSQRNKSMNRIDIMALLRTSQTADSQGKSYYEVIKSIFNKSVNMTMFKTGEK